MSCTASGILLYGVPFKNDDDAYQWGLQFEGENGQLRRQALIVETGCDIEYLGTGSGPAMPYVVASRSETSGCESVAPILATEAWHDRLRRFAARTGLDPEMVDRPGWYLTCSYA